MGVFPDVGLKDARDKRDEARKQIAAHVDPSEHRKAVKLAKLNRAANSFEVIAREWIAPEDQRAFTPLNADGEDMETHHSHGSYPRVDDQRFYHSYHAMMVVAGKLLAATPVHHDPDDSEDDAEENP